MLVLVKLWLSLMQLQIISFVAFICLVQIHSMLFFPIHLKGFVLSILLFCGVTWQPTRAGSEIYVNEMHFWRIVYKFFLPSEVTMNSVMLQYYWRTFQMFLFSFCWPFHSTLKKVKLLEIFRPVNLSGKNKNITFSEHFFTLVRVLYNIKLIQLLAHVACSLTPFEMSYWKEKNSDELGNVMMFIIEIFSVVSSNTTEVYI